MLFFLLLVKVVLTALEITILVLAAVALITLYERKLLANYQRRVGPNVVGIFGFLQPIADGVKLVFKEVASILGTNHTIFTAAPLISMVIAYLLWFIVALNVDYIFAQFIASMGIVLLVLSINALPFILGGWAAHSRYALIGALRTAAQMISYEVIFGINAILLGLLVGTLSLTEIQMAQESCWFVLPYWPMFIIHVLASMAETSRTPFDLPEAEGELVAGYIVEYAAVEFAYFFIAEYTSVLFSSLLTTQLFLGGGLAPVFLEQIIPSGEAWLLIKSFIIFHIIFTFRALAPRERFDQLMQTCWVILLPTIFGLLAGYGIVSLIIAVL